jgi:catechol O-methyltransferase
METIACRLPDADNTGIVRPPPAAAHFAKTASLVAASIAFLPFSTSVVAFSYACNILVPHNGLRRKIRSSPRFRPKTILITGVGTTKGLRIARAFYETGHKVVGADFQALGIPSCGRFSKSLSAYYSLRMPNASSGATLYMRDLIRIVEEENVQLWLSCSELVSAADDGQARELLEHRTSCRTLQVDVETAIAISDSDDFVRFARSIGLV